MSFARAIALAAACISLPSPVAAAERYQIDLPAGRLGEAVAALGRQTRTSIGISDRSLALRPVRAVRGQMTVDQALRRLLRGVDARRVAIDQETFRIVPAPPAPAPVRRPRAQPRAAQPPQPPAPKPPAEQVAEDIIVTASRRAVPLADYAGSVAIVSGADLMLTGRVSGSEALVNRLSTLTSTHLGPGRNKLFVRGISDSSFNGLAQATVGQYFGDSRMNYNTPDPDLRLYDIERIEVLAGPQGTLYGAGSLGGIVRILPNSPVMDSFEGIVSVGASTTAHGDPGAEAAVMLNAPLRADRSVAVRASAYMQREGGYIDDTQRQLEDVNRVRVLGGRLMLRALPGSDWTVDLHALAQTIDGDDAQFAELGEPPLTRRNFMAQYFNNDYLFGGLAATREWGGNRLVLSSNLVRHSLLERFDATREGFLPTAYDLGTRVFLRSAEARLSGASGRYDWLLGGSIVANDARQIRFADQFTYPPYRRNRITNDVVEGAAFGEASMELSPRITGTLGGRASAVKTVSSALLFIPGSPEPESPTTVTRNRLRFLPMASIAMKAASDLLVYSRYQRSFRAGGVAVAGDVFSRFKSDSIASLEVGARYGTPGRGRFDASGAIAFAQWNDVQADTPGIFLEQFTDNIGDARIFTFDLTLGWRPLPGLSLEANGVLNKSKVRNVPAEVGNGDAQLPGVAEFNGRLGAHYEFDGPGASLVRLSSAVRYVGESTLGVGELFEKKQGDWFDASAVLRVELGRNALSLSGSNLLDTKANRFAHGSPFTLDQREFTTPVRPRTFTLSFERSF